jgi:hypothetical protein
MIRADLYEKRIRISHYLTQDDYKTCGFSSQSEFLNALHEGKLDPLHCGLSHSRFYHLLWAVKPDEILPEAEVLQLPEAAPAGLFPINQPDDESPILMSGNSVLTIDVFSAVLSRTISPFWYLVVDTHGHTVDMSMVYEVLTEDLIVQALITEDVNRIAPRSSLFLPGLAAAIAGGLSERCDRSVVLGPICAAELPLFFGEKHWQVAEI